MHGSQLVSQVLEVKEAELQNLRQNATQTLQQEVPSDCTFSMHDTRSYSKSLWKCLPTVLQDCNVSPVQFMIKQFISGIEK